MPNKTATTTGGKLLAKEVLSFMQDNIDAMKSDGANRDAEKNEKQGIEDIANAIAFAIEKVMGGPPMVSPGPSVQLLSTAPVTGTIDLSLANPKYVFK